MSQSVSDKRQPKRNHKNVCVHEGFFSNSTEKKTVTVNGTVKEMLMSLPVYTALDAAVGVTLAVRTSTDR